MGESPISDAERKRNRAHLREFVHAAYEMSKSRFVKRLFRDDQSISFAAGFSAKAPKYDQEDFKSFLTTFRQIAMSKNERIYLPTIRNILSRHAGAELREELHQVKQHIVPIIEGRMSLIRLGKTTASGQIEFTAHQALDAMVNGWIFHRHEDHVASVEIIKEFEPWQYLWIVVFEIVVPVLKVCKWLVYIIKREKLLDDKDFPRTESILALIEYGNSYSPDYKENNKHMLEILRTNWHLVDVDDFEPFSQFYIDMMRLEKEPNAKVDAGFILYQRIGPIPCMTPAIVECIKKKFHFKKSQFDKFTGHNKPSQLKVIASQK